MSEGDGTGARAPEADGRRGGDDQRLIGRLIYAPLERLDGDHRRQLMEAAAARSRKSTRGVRARLRADAFATVQTAVAAGLAWLVADRVLGDPSPFFAPVAAIMSLAATRGQRLREALQVIFGVALGIALGDLLRRELGVGVGQLMLTVGLAMTAAVVLGAGRTLLVEAAVTASLVVTVSEGTLGFPPTRLVDALVGCAVALVFNQLLFPVNPLKLVSEAAESVLGELAQTLTDVAEALQARDLQAAERALVRARRVGEDWSQFEQALQTAREAARYAPPRRRHRDPVSAYDDAGLPLDQMVRDVHVLARGAVRALMIGDDIPARVIGAIRDLSRAIGDLVGRLGQEADGIGAQSIALRAAYAATERLSSDQNLSTSVLIGYIQATAADLLRALGLNRDDAHAKVGTAARAAGG